MAKKDLKMMPTGSKKGRKLSQNAPQKHEKMELKFDAEKERTKISTKTWKMEQLNLEKPCFS